MNFLKEALSLNTETARIIEFSPEEEARLKEIERELGPNLVRFRIYKSLQAFSERYQPTSSPDDPAVNIYGQEIK